MQICIGNAYGPCKKEAEHIRHTQFAGDHPLCKYHAKEDSLFLINSSYESWTKL